MSHWLTFICVVFLVSTPGRETKSSKALAHYKNEKNLMLWNMTHYCISKARDIYFNVPKESKLDLSSSEKRVKSLPYLEKAKQLILELEENYLPDKSETVDEYSVETSSELLKPLDCSDILKSGHTESGVYTIWPADESLEVYCDMVTDGGGWTVIQRRAKFPTQEGFFRGWEDYKNGFGNITQEFWLGNENIYLITNQSQYEIRFDLVDAGGNKRYAAYKTFSLDDENRRYTLHIADYRGDAGDSMAYHNNRAFSTKDSENSFCATDRKAGWWYDHCTKSNLNGLFIPGVQNREGMTWYSWHIHTSLAGSEIKLRKKE